jgi:hypothetical protein
VFAPSGSRQKWLLAHMALRPYFPPVLVAAQVSKIGWLPMETH